MPKNGGWRVLLQTYNTPAVISNICSITLLKIYFDNITNCIKQWVYYVTLSSEVLSDCPHHDPYPSISLRRPNVNSLSISSVSRFSNIMNTDHSSHPLGFQPTTVFGADPPPPPSPRFPTTALSSLAISIPSHSAEPVSRRSSALSSISQAQVARRIVLNY